MVPRSYAPNTVVAIDLLQMPNWDASGQNWYLNMICLGTSFQMVEKLRSKEPVSVWAAFTRTWGRFLGMPQILLLDQGREFLGEFRDRCAELGVLLHVIGARAPHQNGRCERHGGLFKQMMEKAKWQNPPCSEDDLRLLTREVEAAKNRLFNRSGFSPAQRMLGQTARTNGELMSDDAIDPALVNHGEEVEECWQRAGLPRRRSWRQTCPRRLSTLSEPGIACTEPFSRERSSTFGGRGRIKVCLSLTGSGQASF